MKSKRAKHHIENNLCGFGWNTPLMYIGKENAIKSVELAEQEMLEKAIKAFDEISWMIGWIGCSDDDAKEKFLNILDELDNE